MSTSRQSISRRKEKENKDSGVELFDKLNHFKEKKRERER